MNTMPLVEQIDRVLATKADAVVRRAADVLAELIEPGFVYVNAAGRLHDKVSYIDTYCVSGRVVFKSQKASDLAVQDFGDFAVATFLVEDVFVASGGTVAKTYRSLCVFKHDGQRWRWAAGQTMDIAAA